MIHTIRQFTSILLLALVFFPCHSFADSFDHEYKELTDLLSEVVHPDGAKSSVDYSMLKQQIEDLTRIRQHFESVSYREFLNFNPQQKLAFLINAYNVFTLQLVTKHYPLDSIKDIGGDTGPWKLQFISLLDKTYSLDKLEHSLIREKFKDPRIHFALVCAAKSCPPLQAKAYRADTLDEQLEEAATSFIRDQDRNRFDSESNTLSLSMIFSWFADDFGGENGATFFVAHRLKEISQTEVLSAKIAYLPYDWSLNDSTSKLHK